ncbi:PREDICTED: uncharacterized protein LOC109475704, partial [Branchiostoma belcheri]|uniref:Uncharacterized protein LOC109475704 n=1 Tax=Branchiostoma belcheri TaxID=7741 RepID=A0A6P4YRF3_BRABE
MGRWSHIRQREPRGKRADQLECRAARGNWSEDGAETEETLRRTATSAAASSGSNPRDAGGTAAGRSTTGSGLKRHKWLRKAVPIQVQVPQQAPPLHVQAQAAAPLAVPGQAQAAVTQAAPVQAHAQAAPQAAPDQAQAAPQAIPVQAQAAQAIPVQAQAAPQAAMLQGQAAAPQAQGNDWQQRLEALEKAHRTEGVRESLEQVLDLAKAPSHLNHALLIPALRRLEEKARAAGHPDYPTYAATLRHATLHEKNSMLGEMVLRALGSDVDDRIGSKFAKVVKQSGYHTQSVWPPPPPPPQWFPPAQGGFSTVFR